LGSVLGRWLGPVVSHCSLDAASAERPRPTAPVSTQTVLVATTHRGVPERRVRAAPSEQHARA